jgi:hypothetical protein
LLRKYSVDIRVIYTCLPSRSEEGMGVQVSSTQNYIELNAVAPKNTLAYV